MRVARSRVTSVRAGSVVFKGDLSGSRPGRHDERLSLMKPEEAWLETKCTTGHLCFLRPQEDALKSL